MIIINTYLKFLLERYVADSVFNYTTGGIKMDVKYTFQTLDTNRLVLRGFKAEDLEFVYEHFSNPDVCQYLYDNEPLGSIEKAQEIIDAYAEPETKDHNRWVLVNKATQQEMGTCGFHCWDQVNNCADIGYDLEKKYWKKGYMKEALNKILRFGFNKMQLNRVQAFVALENKASCRLLESLGFKREGIIRENHFYRGKYYDHYCYSLLKKEYRYIERTESYDI